MEWRLPWKQHFLSCPNYCQKGEVVKYKRRASPAAGRPLGHSPKLLQKLARIAVQKLRAQGHSSLIWPPK
jgi:hypothetical protein